MLYHKTFCKNEKWNSCRLRHFQPEKIFERDEWTNLLSETLIWRRICWSSLVNQPSRSTNTQNSAFCSIQLVSSSTAHVPERTASNDESIFKYKADVKECCSPPEPSLCRRVFAKHQKQYPLKKIVHQWIAKNRIPFYETTANAML